MMRKAIVCFSMIGLFSSMIMGVQCQPAEAALEATSEAKTAETVQGTPPNEDSEYSEYDNAFAGWASPAEDIQVKMDGGVLGKQNDCVTKTISVPANGRYELRLNYQCNGMQDAVVTLEIDGKIPFENAERLTFPMFWTNADQQQRDEAGNEFSPDQILYRDAVSAKAQDYSGRYENPYRFALSAGKHVITLRLLQGEMTLKGIDLCRPEQANPYRTPSDNKTSDTARATPIVLEGEQASLKNSRSLIPLSDGSSPLINPCDPGKTKLNYIGGSNWEQPGRSLSWNFEVKTAGYYSLGFIYRQNYNLGGVSFRRLELDGKLPFEEAGRVKFLYNSGWKYMDYTNGDNPYWIYLDAGKHTLTLTATAGEISEIYQSLQEVTASMGDLYVDITKIVGETVDIYRSYELFNQIPNFNGRLTQDAKQLEAIAGKLETLQEKSSGSSVSLVRNAIRVIRQMIDNPYTAHRYKSDFYDAYTNLSSLMGGITDMPLDIDRIILTGRGAVSSAPSVSLFDRFTFSVRRFVSSFSKDYQMSTGDESGSLKIWVNWGRDQAQVLNSLIQDSFVRDYGIHANVSIVNATLIQAILAGDGPDVMLQLGRTEPVNYAMRGALYDLRKFEDLPEVLKRFNTGAEVPYQYEGGLYALPDTQSFYLMFLRTDILSKLGIDPPKTWDEFITASNLLQRNNLQVYVPGQTNANGQSIYPTLLIQNGLSLYNEGQTASTLTKLPQIKVFTEMANWYTKYKLPVTADFYNRFRVGSAPIGIYDYSMYTQLKAAAPEIDGRWTVTEIPGVRQQDGTINRQSAGTGTGCAITRFSKNPNNAWKFLKWWTSAETQTAYSQNLESAIGPLGRLAASNLEAFAGMDWDKDMLKSILAQQRHIVEMPEVPGGYYTSRCLSQAYWEVVEQGEPAMESMMKWGEILDNEIKRKRAEYITVK